MQPAALSMYKRLIMATLRLGILAIAFIVLLAAAGNLASPPELTARFTPEQQVQAAAVLPLVGLIMSSCLSYLALRSRWHGWRLAGALFIILYGIYTFLSQIETAVFPAIADQLPEGTLRGFFVSGLALAVPFSLLAVWILKKTRKDPSISEARQRLRIPAGEWVWKLGAAAILYVIVYFTFGYYVAWRTPGLPEFYGGSDPGSFLALLPDSSGLGLGSDRMSHHQHAQGKAMGAGPGSGPHFCHSYQQRTAVPQSIHAACDCPGTRPGSEFFHVRVRNSAHDPDVVEAGWPSTSRKGGTSCPLRSPRTNGREVSKPS
jgi:hypothetical protein